MNCPVNNGKYPTEEVFWAFTEKMNESENWVNR